MSLANTKEKFVDFKCTQSLSICLSIHSGCGATLLKGAIKSPSNPRSIPPQPENNDNTFSFLEVLTG